MKLYFMKQKAIDYIKANIKSLYMNYYKYANNEWIYDLFDYDPFELFLEIPDFELCPVTSGTAGEIELENCKILYSKLKMISESQASDERLWAGLCNGAFYTYVRARWNYSKLVPKNPRNDASGVISRFFFSGGGRSGLFRNTLAKCWWVGMSTYRGGLTDHWRLLDAIGPEDFATKVSDIFFSNTFAANPAILEGICNGMEFFKNKGQKLLMKDHIRPTMQYMNALGGGILLDALTSEDVTNLVIENIGRIKNGEQQDFFESSYDASSDSEEEETIKPDVKEVNIDYQEEQEQIEQDVIEIDEEEVLGVPEEVERGCTVLVHNKTKNKDMSYVIPGLDERELYWIESKLLGKKVGDTVKVRLDEYEVLSIRR